MTLTQFLPVYLALMVFALRSPRNWVVAMGICCFFQGATPFLLHGGGRMVGLPPAYLLISVGLMHELHAILQHGQRRGPLRTTVTVTAPQLWLLAFTVIAVAGAFILPRLFAGVAHAMPIRGSLDSGLFLPIYPNSSNTFQAIYLVLNALIVALVSRMMVRNEADALDVVRGVTLGALCASGFGLYQLIAYYTGLPWPSDFVNSNLGVGQFPEQVVSSVKRISATFWEPSLLSYNFVGTIGLLLLGGLATRVGWLVLVVQLLSTSSVGYVAFLLLAAIWMVFASGSQQKKLRAAMAGMVVIALALAADFAFTDGKVTSSMLINKASSDSAINRSYANYLGLQSFLETWGLGVGMGSARASSLFATLLATTGVLGMATFVAFLLSLLSGSIGSADPIRRAFGFSLIGFSAVWLISIPDIAQPTFWLIAGGAVGYRIQGAFRTSATRPASLGHRRIGACQHA